MSVVGDVLFCLWLALWVWMGLRLIEADGRESREGEEGHDAAVWD